MAEPIKIRMGGYGPPTTSFSRSLKLIGDRLSARFGDRISVDYVWNIMDFGHRAEEILTLVENGEMTLGYQSSSYLTDRVPELGFVDLPFLFEHRDQARTAIDGELGRFLSRSIEARINYRILGYFENGFRHISNRLRTVRTPADLKGMRIRVLPSEVQARTFELLGAIPLRWDLTEAIAAIKAGTIDAQENPFANTVTLQSVQRQSFSKYSIPVAPHCSSSEVTRSGRGASVPPFLFARPLLEISFDLLVSDELAVRSLNAKDRHTRAPSAAVHQLPGLL